MAVLETVRAVGFVGVWTAVALWPFLIVFLNPRFDPDWKHRRWTKFEAEAIPVFPLFRMVLYVPAVCSRFFARRLFGVVDGEEYDFRGRACPILYALCMVEAVVGVAGGIIGLFAHYSLKFIQ